MDLTVFQSEQDSTRLKNQIKQLEGKIEEKNEIEYDYQEELDNVCSKLKVFEEENLNFVRQVLDLKRQLSMERDVKHRQLEEEIEFQKKQNQLLDNRNLNLVNQIRTLQDEKNLLKSSVLIDKDKD